MKTLISLLLFFSFILANTLNIKESYYESYNYEKMGDYKDAIKVLIPIYEKYPNGYTINLRLAYLFFLNKNYQNAIKHYKKASTILPYSLEPKLGLMRVYLAIGDYKKLYEIGDIVLKTDYYNYYGNYYYALGLYYNKKFKSALNLVNKMLAIYPTDIMYLTLLGEIYINIDKNKAMKIFKELIILDPNNIIAKKYLK